MSLKRMVAHFAIGLGLGVSLMAASCGDEEKPAGGQIVVTAPVAGTELLTGDTITVTWDLDVASPTFQGNYNITGTTWQDLVMVEKLNGTSAKVQLPNSVRYSNTFQIKVSDASGAKDAGASGECPIKHIILTSPVGGEVYAVDETHDITWRASKQMISVRVILSTDDGMSSKDITTAAIDPKLGKYTWAIGREPSGSFTYPSTLCRVKVQEYNERLIFDESPTTFTVNQP